jgi:hypothetical protein
VKFDPIQSPKFLRATDTERLIMRREFFDSSCAEVTIWSDPDACMWVCDIAGVITEHATVGELFRYLAEVAEEC